MMQRRPKDPSGSPPQSKDDATTSSGTRPARSTLTSRSEEAKPGSRGWSSALLLYLVLGGCMLTGYWYSESAHGTVPEPLPADVPRNEFSEGRAFPVLEDLMNSIGFRVFGTKNNDVHTFNWVLDHLKQSQLEARKHDPSLPPDAGMEVVVQKASGSYSLEFLDVYLTNAYTNISNVIARVYSRASRASPKRDYQRPALLVNSHFDSGVCSKGASDDGVATALIACFLLQFYNNMQVVSLELVRNVLAEPPEDYDVIFLFNGAEEPLLPAAHAFTTQHPWANSVKAVINMESAGAGGASLMFQTNSLDLVTAYSHVPHPHTCVVATEVFGTGLIPSDTDFRIFRDEGKIPGIDIAFYRNGYVYHTALDDTSQVTPGSIQHMGANTLALIRYITSASRSGAFLPNITFASSFPVFYDLFGMTIYYSSRTGVILNLATSFFAFLYIRLTASSLRRVSSLAVGLVVCAAASAIGPALLGLAMDFVLNRPLTFYARPSLGVCMHLVAGCLLFLIVMKFVIRRFARPAASSDSKKSDSLFESESGANSTRDVDALIHQDASLEDDIACAALLLFAILTVALTIAGLASAFVPQVLVFLLFIGHSFHAVSKFVLRIFFSSSSSNDGSRSSSPSSNSPKVNHYGRKSSRRSRSDGMRGTSSSSSIGDGLLSAVGVARYVIATVPACVGLFYLFRVALQLLLPLFGRTGAMVPGDAVVGVIAGVLGAFLMFVVVPFVVHIRRYNAILAALGILFLVLLVVAICSFPYSPLQPKRLVIQHTHNPPTRTIRYSPPPSSSSSSTSSSSSSSSSSSLSSSSTDASSQVPSESEQLSKSKHGHQRDASSKNEFPYGYTLSDTIDTSPVDPEEERFYASGKNLILLGSLDRIPADYVLPRDKSARDALNYTSPENQEYHFFPIYPFHSFISALQFPARLPSPRIFSSGKMEHVKVRVVNDRYNEKFDVRSVSLLIDFTGFEVSSAIVDASSGRILQWAFEPVDEAQRRLSQHTHATTAAHASPSDDPFEDHPLPPAPKGHYFVRQISSYGTRQWTLSLKVKGRLGFSVDVSATHYTATEDGMKLYEMMPEWTTPYLFYSEVSTWIVENSKATATSWFGSSRCLVSKLLRTNNLCYCI